MHKITCMEISGDNHTVYLAGIGAINGSPTKATFKCIPLDNFSDSRPNVQIQEAASISMVDVNYGTPRCISRIKGSEYLLLGCDMHIAILDYDYKTRTITKLNTLFNLHETKICSIICSGSYLFTKGHNEQLLKVTKFGSDRPVDMEKHFQPSNLFFNPSANINHTDVQYIDPNSEYKIFASNRIQVGHKNLEKVVTSKNGERLYVGGSGLHLFKF